MVSERAHFEVAGSSDRVTSVADVGAGTASSSITRSILLRDNEIFYRFCGFFYNFLFCIGEVS